MKKPRLPALAPRKTPRQARAVGLVEDLLEAAVRVLTRDGARRFTTVRVAEEAGVSVGSLYQYFPSKEALLFRLQSDEWEDTWSILEEMLGDETRSPEDRLRRCVLTFFRSEREEASLRRALDDTGALFREAPEARAHLARAHKTMETFLESWLPDVPKAARAFAAELVLISMAAVGEKLTERPRPRAEVDAWAKASADMYVGYLRQVGGVTPSPPPPLPSPSRAPPPRAGGS